MTAATPTTADQRKVRFANIDGLTPADLPLAFEVWLQQLYKAPFATKEMMKLGAYLVRYMSNPEAVNLNMGDLEVICQLSPDETRKTFSVMRGFGVIDSFVIDKTNLQVALTLSLLQRLDVLEAKRRFSAVLPGAQRIWTEPTDRWQPGRPVAVVQKQAAPQAA